MKLFLVFLFFLFACDYIPPKKKSSKAEKMQASLLAFLLAPKQVGDFYAQAFYLNPLFLETKNYNFFEKVSFSNVPSTKKKILFVHGWQPKDRDSNPIPSEQDLKLRIVDNIWKEVFATNFFSTLTLKEYELYFFTYLTSNSISSNGTRLLGILDSFFANSSNLYIIAHSMGGLVVRDALYKSNSSLFLQEVFTLGTPFHGSPWASLEFQESKTLLGEYATFITETSGGKDLGWDNFDSSLNNAKNSYLQDMNSKAEKDSFITAYFGELDKNASGYAGSFSWLNPACLGLGDKFSPSDCIVPLKSARGDGLNFKNRFSLGNYNHLDLNLKASQVQSQILSKLP